MTSKVAVSVFESPAVALLCELEDAAHKAGSSLTATAMPNGKVHLAPKAILTPERIARVREHRDALHLLICICDDEVQARRVGFARQIAVAGAFTVLPALRFVPGGPAVDDACVSCGNSTDTPSWCWRCQLAARLATHGNVPVDWAAATRQLSTATV